MTCGRPSGRTVASQYVLGFSGFSRRSQRISRTSCGPSSTSGARPPAFVLPWVFSASLFAGYRGWLLPHRYVLPALAGERLGSSRTTIPQPHPGQLRHEVKLAGPHVAEGIDRRSSWPSTSRKWWKSALAARHQLVDAPVPVLRAEDRCVSPGGRRCSSGTSTSIRKQPPGRGAPPRCGSRPPAPLARSGS